MVPPNIRSSCILNISHSNRGSSHVSNLPWWHELAICEGRDCQHQEGLPTIWKSDHSQALRSLSPHSFFTYFLLNESQKLLKDVNLFVVWLIGCLVFYIVSLDHQAYRTLIKNIKDYLTQQTLAFGSLEDIPLELFLKILEVTDSSRKRSNNCPYCEIQSEILPILGNIIIEKPNLEPLRIVINTFGFIKTSPVNRIC